MLGFFHNCRLLELFCNTDYRATEESFLIPAYTKGFLPRDPDGRYGVSDCRHGRVLLNSWDHSDDDGVQKFVVWDPMTGSHRPLVVGPDECIGTWDHVAAVLCDVGGCDHAACHMGPFRVVYICIDTDDGHVMGARVFVYSSNTR
jgi:hypothetical protein